MARFLVTGGAGFIGSNIVEELLRRGQSVRVLDNFATGRRENLHSFRDDIELVEGDIRSLSSVQRATRGIDYVLHQAALPSVPRSVADPMNTHEVNTTGTLNVLTAARDCDVRRVVFASSSSVYGNDPRQPKNEEMRPRPMSPYAISKLTGESYCSVFNDLYDLDTVVLRYFNVFGPKQDPASEYSAVIPKFIHQLLDAERPTIYGDGKQTRDFTFVSTVVAANLQACYAESLPKERIFNCACGQQHMLLAIFEQVRAIIGSELDPRFAPTRPGDVRDSFAEIARAVRYLNLIPKTSIADGLERTVRWFVEQRVHEGHALPNARDEATKATSPLLERRRVLKHAAEGAPDTTA